MKRALAILSITVLTAIACGKSEETATTETTATTATTSSSTSTTEAPALPADVAAVGTAVTNTTTAATASAAEGDPSTLVATGEFVSPVRSELSPKLPGRVARLYVDEGSRVTKGQPVLELETEYSRLNLQSAEADVARAKAARDEAQRDLARKKDLIAKQSIPQATYDRSQAAYDGAQAALQAASAQANLLRQQIADATLRSPVTGVVAQKRTDVGARLGDGGVAFVVVQLSPLKLRFAVPERYLAQIDKGARVVARVDPYPKETFEGTIKTIGGVIDPQTRTMFAEAEFPNRDGRLKPGLFARVEVKLN
ncbi:MAG TPA: efflux RND transporter periplasmic adaptor subunit [Thermoanaerobaculia bacterium]|nr:efflux RND transporter periplasmic adaptor subunit [Thermoanaerobaculia bacterium]